MKQQSLNTAISTTDLVSGLHEEAETCKLTLRDLAVVAEQSVLAIGACGLVHYLM